MEKTIKRQIKCIQDYPLEASFLAGFLVMAWCSLHGMHLIKQTPFI